MERQGQRILLALSSSTGGGGNYSDKFSVPGILAAIGGVMCLIFIVLMCACKDRDCKDEEEDIELQQSSKKADKKLMAQVTPDNADTKYRNDVETVAANGGTIQAASTLPGHSRQASSGSAHMRPTSLRELPAPPVSTPNKALSGVEPPSISVKAGSSGSSSGTGSSSDYAYPQHVHHTRNNKSTTSSSVTPGKEKVKSQSDGYDHLGPKRSVKPTDYDSLGDPESTDGETPVSEAGGGLDDHYSQLRERTYAVVVDVKAKAKELFDPYSKVKDKEDGSSDYYSQLKEEDPYNHISDSGGNVSTSFIRQLRQSRDNHDTYASVQGDTEGDLNSVLESRGTARETGTPVIGQTDSSTLNMSKFLRGTLPHNVSTASSRISNTPSTPPDDEDVEEEYAVVQKAKGNMEQTIENDVDAYDDGNISLYSVGPPEPPRLYNDYDSAEDSLTSAAPTSYKREHKYSKVTARESLASMSARNALNPYEVVMDLPENTYATVEGGSGDGIVMRAGATGSTLEKRLSQTSDTYAEIGISGGGLSSSIISSSSSTGGHNNSSSSVAPVPPSLDSLHLMTKSQTSSEGDRLSDRHLASPEDSGMSLNLWGDGQDDDDSEDGYSTLKKLDCSPQTSSLPSIPVSSHITDEESGEVTLVPNYQTVKDCIPDNEAMEEAENDPNYESVDELRAKVALLKARNASLLDSRTSPFSSQAGASGHMNFFTSLTLNSTMGSGVDFLPTTVEQPKGSVHRRRRLDHDYEEVDLSPPSSPVSMPSSMNHTTSSSYHVTSCTNTSSLTANSQMTTEAILVVTEARERAIDSHMYEELAEVRAKTLEMNKAKKGNAQIKNSSEDKKKTSSIDKKKSEEKLKSSSEDKRKNVSEDKRKSSGEDKKKSTSDEKRKNASDDKKKVGLSVINGTRL